MNPADDIRAARDRLDQATAILDAIKPQHRSLPWAAAMAQVAQAHIELSMAGTNRDGVLVEHSVTARLERAIAETEAALPAHVVQEARAATAQSVTAACDAALTVARGKR